MPKSNDPAKAELDAYLARMGYGPQDEASDAPSVGFGMDAAAATDAGLASSHTKGQSASDSGLNTSQNATLHDRYQSNYYDRIKQTPSLESNRWAGERGESVCTPSSDEARRILDGKGLSGVPYQGGVPDFSPFSESTVKLGYMTDERHSHGLTAGRDSQNTTYAHFDENGEMISKSHRADYNSMADLHMKYDKPGNFEQADILTAEQWTTDGKGGKEWTAEDVAEYRKDNCLTWHECNDMETMQMIPEAINSEFGHLGGVAEAKATERIVNEAMRDYDEGQMIEAADYDQMTELELQQLERVNGHYDEDGSWIPDAVYDQALSDKRDSICIDRSMSPETEILANDAHISPAAEILTDDTHAPPETKMLAENIFAESIDRAEAATQEPQDAILDATSEQIVGVSFEEASDNRTEETVDEIAEESVNEAIDNTIKESAEEMADDNTEGAVNEIVEKPVEEPVDDAAKESVEDLLNEAVEEPVDKMMDEAVVEPVNETALEHTEEAIDEINEEPVEESTDEIVEESLGEQVDEVTDKSIEEPVEEAIDEPVEETIEEPAEEKEDEAIEEPVDEIIETPAIETVDDAIEELAEEPIDDATEEPIEGPVNDVIEEPVEKLADETIVEPTEELIAEPIEGCQNETIDDLSDPSDVLEETEDVNDNEHFADENIEPVEEETDDSFEDLSDDTDLDTGSNNHDDLDSISDEDSGDLDDYSSMADEMADAATDDSAYSDLADDILGRSMDTMDNSDMSDDIDTGLYDDSSFDAGVSSFDSGENSGSFVGGGGSF